MVNPLSLPSIDLRTWEFYIRPTGNTAFDNSCQLVLCFLFLNFKFTSHFCKTICSTAIAAPVTSVSRTKPDPLLFQGSNYVWFWLYYIATDVIPYSNYINWIKNVNSRFGLRGHFFCFFKEIKPFFTRDFNSNFCLPGLFWLENKAFLYHF